MPAARASIICAAFASLIAPGCSKPNTDNPEGSQKIALLEVFDLYADYVKTNQKPPQKLGDLTTKEAQLISPGAVRALQSGECVVVWNTDLAANPRAVLAYQKSAPTAGGSVLLANGEVKEMTADEFKAAPKAK